MRIPARVNGEKWDEFAFAAVKVLFEVEAFRELGSANGAALADKAGKLPVVNFVAEQLVPAIGLGSVMLASLVGFIST